jgi:hypothetical protein
MRRFAPSVLVVFLVVVAESRAQTSPPPPIPLGPPLTLPATLTGTKIDLNFAANSTVGVRLTNLVHHEGGNFTFVNDPAGVGRDWRLWEIRGTKSNTSPSAYSVSPANVATSAGFKAYYSTAGTGVPAFAFVWDPIVVNSTNALRVVVQVALAPNDSVSRWRCEVTRSQPPGIPPPMPMPTASLDEIDLPIVWFVPPIPTRAGESILDAQIRARVLIPQSAFGPIPSSNQPFKNFLQAGNGADFDFVCNHPNGGSPTVGNQSLQFAALYCADSDPSASASFRKMLYMGTEDTTGYYKRFRYLGVNYSNSGTIAYRLGWRAIAFPSYADASGAPSKYANIHASPYPAVLGALRAKDDSFWFDACDYYRGFVESSGMAGPKLEVNPRIGKSKGPVVLGFHIWAAGQPPPPPPPPPPPNLHQRFLDITKAWKNALANPYTSSGDLYMHWQNVLVNGIGTENPDYPVVSSVDPGVSAPLTSATALGFRTEPYTRPVDLTKSLAWFPSLFPPSIEAYDASGQPYGGSKKADVDFAATPLAATWAADHIVDPLISQVGFSSVYLDVLGGAGSNLTYDNPVAGPQHIAHGGDRFIQGKVQLADYTRTVVQSKSPFAVGSPPNDPDAIVTTELVEEYMTSHVDFAGQGYDWVPHHLLLAEDTFTGTTPAYGPSGAPPATTDWSPPLWNAVYHEWLPATSLLVPFSSVGLRSNTQAPHSGAGMTDAEWIDLFCWAQSCAYVTGSRASVLNDVIDADYPMVTVDPNNANGWIVDTNVDPNATGITIMGMMRTLYQSLAPTFAGPWLLTGKMQRPLQVDYVSSSSEVEKALNPTNASKVESNPPTANAFYCYPLTEYPGRFILQGQFGSQVYNVPKVLHSVWKNSANATAIVLVNWTGSQAIWAGTLDLTLYGISGSPSLKEMLINGNLVPLGGLSSSTTIHAKVGTNISGHLYVGRVPARSVRLFLVQ